MRGAEAAAAGFPESWGSRIACWCPGPARAHPGVLRSRAQRQHAEFEREIGVERTCKLQAAPGVTLGRAQPLKGAGRSGTFVGRLRADQAFAPVTVCSSSPSGTTYHQVGAALNAVELAELVAAGG